MSLDETIKVSDSIQTSLLQGLEVNVPRNSDIQFSMPCRSPQYSRSLMDSAHSIANWIKGSSNFQVKQINEVQEYTSRNCFEQLNLELNGNCEVMLGHYSINPSELSRHKSWRI
jgi:hypothetical protein